MMKGKRLYIMIVMGLTTVTAVAQPSFVKKATRSVFTLKTFAADGSLIANSNGFYVGTNGEAVSSFEPFKGAARAIVIDAQGKEWQVESILGANDVYDVAKFRTSNPKSLPLVLSPSIAAEGSVAWLLPYRETKNIPKGTVRQASTIQEKFAYYTLALSIPEHAESSPLLNDDGEVIGIVQRPALSTDTLNYAVSAVFADSLHTTAFSPNDPVLLKTQIKKELPDDLKEANLAIYLASTRGDSIVYITLINDMIRKFPNEPDGYTYRAQTEASRGDFAAAELDMSQALRLSEHKDEAHFNLSRMIYNKVIYQNDLPYDNWNLDKALGEIREAIQLNPLPTYRQQEGHILYAQKKYDEAYEVYMQLSETDLRSAEVFFSAAQCKAQLRDTTAMLALLDSTVNTFSKPYLKEAAPYLWERAVARREAGKYRDAISDMNDYEQLMAASVNDNFYYIRHQTEISARLYQQALNDIDRAIQLDPKETLYYAEKASLQVRVGLFDGAIDTARECIAVDPENSDGYLFLGLAQCMKGDKQQGLSNLRRAKELGDNQADALIEKYK